MLLRRMSGCVLALALLIGAAWPEVCSACDTRVATEECGAKHGAALHAKVDEGAATFRAAGVCRDCGGEAEMIARHGVQHDPPSCATLAAPEAMGCSSALQVNAGCEPAQRLTVPRFLTVRDFRIGPGDGSRILGAGRGGFGRVDVKGLAPLLSSVGLKI